MNKKFFKAKSLLILLLYTLIIILYGQPIYSSAIPETAKCNTGISISPYSKLNSSVRPSSRLFELFFGKGEDEPVMLYPGGSVFGLLLDEEGATVCSSSSKAILRGDRIMKISGEEITSIDDVERLVSESGGRKVELEIIRSGAPLKINVIPTLDNGEYKLGVTLRFHTAGIGTLTYILPDSLEFGGLGHGVNDGEGGGYVNMRSGKVTEAVLGGCKKGEIGKAGELVGILKKSIKGKININNECGVFGSLTELPDYATELIPAASRSNIKCGEAEIISTVKGIKRQHFKIEIKEINENSTGSKSFKVHVTDPALIALTGGIVRGMSGSPIIQNGKLVGAVTHVMVANPTEGYGIFIENMLEAAQQGVQPKAA